MTGGAAQRGGGCRGNGSADDCMASSAIVSIIRKRSKGFAKKCWNANVGRRLVPLRSNRCGDRAGDASWRANCSRTATRRAMFVRRGTAIPEAPPVALTAAFATDASKAAQWKGFVTRGGLAPAMPMAPPRPATVPRCDESRSEPRRKYVSRAQRMRSRRFRAPGFANELLVFLVTAPIFGAIGWLVRSRLAGGRAFRIAQLAVRARAPEPESNEATTGHGCRLRGSPGRSPRRHAPSTGRSGGEGRRRRSRAGRVTTRA